MKTYLRMQLALEHHKEFSNQGIRSAVTIKITRLSREDEESSEVLTLNYMFEALMWTWRRVMANAHKTQVGVPQEVNESTKNERALIACAMQIVVEKAAKQGNRANEAKMAQEDRGVVLVRKELADLRNTQNQQKQAMDRLKEKAQYDDRSGGYYRQRRGGYGQDGLVKTQASQGPIISGASGISAEEKRIRNKARSSVQMGCISRWLARMSAHASRHDAHVHADSHGAGNGTRPIKAPVTRKAIFLPDFFILKNY